MEKTFIEMKLRYFSKENKPQLFTKSHDDLWDDISVIVPNRNCSKDYISG